MFERFSDEARRTVVRALVEARLLGHEYVGTEHTLIALAAGGGTATVLATEGVTVERARVAVADVVAPDSASTAWDDGPYTARAKHTFELGLREAFGLDHHYVTNGHLLLGLLRLGQGNGVRALESLGVDLAHLRHRVAAGIESEGPPVGPPERRPLTTAHRLAIQTQPAEVDLRDDPRTGAGSGADDEARHGYAPAPGDGHGAGDVAAPAGGAAVTNGAVANGAASSGTETGSGAPTDGGAGVLHACSFCETALGHGDRFIAGAHSRICVECVQASARLLGVMEALSQDFTLVFDGQSRTATLSVGSSPAGR